MTQFASLAKKPWLSQFVGFAWYFFFLIEFDYVIVYFFYYIVKK